MGTRAAAPLLIGRDRELDRLVRDLDTAASGQPSTALVAGEAGVGKSRLIDVATAHAEERRFSVHVGHCVDLGEMIWPLAPLREIVAGLEARLDQAAFDAVAGPARPVIARLLDHVDATPADDPLMSGDQLCELALGVFRRLGRRGPLLVVFEDLHWADASTRTLLSGLARVARIDHLLLVGTFRAEELHRRHPLRPTLAELERMPTCHRIDLQPLDLASTARLVAALTGPDVETEVVREIHRRSSGNPFFVEELVAARLEGTGNTPGALRDVVLARAGNLDDDALELLALAAAAGATTAEVLGDAGGLPGGALNTALDRLITAGMLVLDGDEVRFRHELGREVFYDELMPGERTAVHAALATSLEAHRPQRLGEIARHWAAANDVRRGLVTFIAAGRQVLATGAAAEAEGHFERALDLWSTTPDPEALTGQDFPALLVETATAAKYAGHLDRAIEFGLRAVAALDHDPLRQADAWLELRSLYRFTDRWEERIDALDRALAVIPSSPPTQTLARALADAAMEDVYQGRAAEALVHAREAVDVADAVGGSELAVYARHTLVIATGEQGDPELALELARANLDRCGPRVRPELTMIACNDVANALERLARYEEILPITERAISIARASGLAGPTTSWVAAHWVESLVWLGRWREAERVVGTVADLFESPAESGQLGLNWGIALLRQGRVDEARPHIERTRARLHGERWPQDLAINATAVAKLEAVDGRFDVLVDLVSAVLDEADVPDQLAYLVATGVEELASAARTGRLSDRAPSVDQAATAIDRWIERLETRLRDGWRPDPDAALDVDHARAHRDRFYGRARAESWAALAEGWARLSAPYEEAEARLRWAESLLAGEDGRSSEARVAAAPQLRAAAAIARDLGAAPLLAQIESLATRARVALDHLDQAAAGRHDFGLSPREREVLALLAAGRSNGQIGRELFISAKTASVHVSNILRKLGVTNRVEAALLSPQILPTRPTNGRSS